MTRASIPAGVALALAASLVAGAAGRAGAAVGHSGHRGAQPAQAGDISTIAGSVGSGKATSLAERPCDLAFSRGALLEGEGSTIARINPQNDRLTTLAGNGTQGPLPAGGDLATADGISACYIVVDHRGNIVFNENLGHNQVSEILVLARGTGTFYGQAMTAGHLYVLSRDSSSVRAVDSAGNLLIADPAGNLVQVLAERWGTFYGQKMRPGDIYTVAGDGVPGYTGDGGPATSAELDQPWNVTPDAAGNLVIADFGNNRIRVVADSTGTFYGRSMTAGHIYTVAGGGKQNPGFGGPAKRAELAGPSSVAIDAAGNLVFTNSNSGEVAVAAEHTGSYYGQSMTAGDLYLVAGNGHYGNSGDGGPATSAEMQDPFVVTLDGQGDLLIADTTGNEVRMVAENTGTFYGQAMTAGDIYTVSGNGSQAYSGDYHPAIDAQISFGSVTQDSAGNLVVSDGADNRIRVIAESTGTFYGHAMTAGKVYTVAGDGVAGYDRNGQFATLAEFYHPSDVTLDGSGNLVITDEFNHRIRVLAASTGTFYGQSMKTGHSYTVAGDGTAGYSGDGGPALDAELYYPQSTAVDGAGNLVIADSANNRVRVVAASTGTFYGQSMTVGDIYTVAGDGTTGYTGNGGPATAAEMNSPTGVTVDGAGNLVITDRGNSVIRVVAATSGTFYGQSMTAGDIYPVAGDGSRGYTGDGGPATSAQLDVPFTANVDRAGNLIIADGYNSVIRVVAATSGTFYGQSMTAGAIYTVAGDGSVGYSGDGGPATSAELDYPQAAIQDSAGDLLIADDIRLRTVSG